MSYTTWSQAAAPWFALPAVSVASGQMCASCGRLLFHQAAREPEFRADTDRFDADMVAMAHDHFATAIPDPAWARWAAQLAPATTIAAITAWLDAGQPDPEVAATRIGHLLRGLNKAAITPHLRPPSR